MAPKVTFSHVSKFFQNFDNNNNLKLLRCFRIIIPKFTWNTLQNFFPILFHKSLETYFLKIFH